MDNNILNKYKREMIKMYNSVNAEPVATAFEPEVTPPQNQNSAQGKLLSIVTAVRGLYPISNAKVTVFTGEYDNMNIIDTALTDQSGRTKFFVLPTPEIELSLDQTNTASPYAKYNMLVEADGYIKNLHLNIPVFSTITSIQQSNLLLEETAGENKGPQIFNESQNYDL